MRRWLPRVPVLLGGLVACAAPATAQQAGARVELYPRVGAYLPERASALDANLQLGVQVLYALTPALRAGFEVAGTRTVTRPRFFRPAALDFGTRIELYDVQQEVDALQYAVQAGLAPMAGTLQPYLLVGAGGYTFFLGGESNQRVARVSGLQLSAAGGLALRVNDRSGVTLELRDYLLLDYDQEALNPVRPRSRDTVFYERWPRSPAPKDQVHVLAVGFGFTYHP